MKNTAQQEDAYTKQEKNHISLIFYMLAISCIAVFFIFLYEFLRPLIIQTQSPLFSYIFAFAYFLPISLFVVFILLRNFEKKLNAKNLTELKIIETEQKYQSLIQNIPEIVWTTNERGKTTFISSDVEELLGFSPQEFYTNDNLWFDQIHPDDKNTVKKAFENLFTQNKEFDIEYRFKSKDGRWIWLHDRSNKIYEKESEKYADGIFSDVTEKKLAIEKIQLHSKLLDAINQAIIYTDLTGTIIYWNKFAENLYGWKKEEVIGKIITDITPSNATQKQAEEIMSRLKAGKTWQGEFMVKRKDNSEFPAYVADTPFIDDDKNLVGIIGTSMDISDRKKDEEKLKLRSQELEENQKSMLKLLSDLSTQKTKLEQEKAKDDVILESIGEGLVVTDGRGKILLLNKTAEMLLGWTTEEIFNRDYVKIIESLDEKKNKVTDDKRPLALALSTSKKISGRYFYRHRDGNTFPVSVTATPIIQNNEVVGSVTVFHDITKEIEVDRMKTEFVSVASHELRTPLTAIDGLISMVLDGEYGPINENLKQPLEDVNNSSERLIHLVNDLLNVSRIEEGRMKYSLSDFPISPVIDEAIELLQPIAKEKNVLLSKGEFPEGNVQGDPDKVKQILNNLLGNSLKFTDRGSITASATVNGDFVEIAVIDTGIGIARQDWEKLFGKFQQLNSDKGRPVGTGLGLHISREMARNMGGDVWLERSESGKGSIFKFSLPLARSESAKKAKQAIEKESRVNIEQQADSQNTLTKT